MTNKEASEILLDMANELQLISESKQGQAFKMALKLLDNENVLDNIRAEIDRIGTIRQIDAYTSYIRTGDQVKQMALGIIDKYIKEVRN